MSNPIAWTEVRVLVPTGWQELVADRLCTGPCTTAAFGRSNLIANAAPEGFDFVRTFLADSDDTPQARALIERAIASLATDTGMEELADLKPVFKALPAEDYATSWRKTWKPFRVGKLAVIPSWSPLEPRADDIRLTLEPGGAFGSGRHVTTRTCLMELQERLRPGSRVLDAGSGSGILSVAAVLLGAKSALGFDVDKHAQVYASSLARDNHVEDRCEFRTGSFEILREADSNYDVVLGNIYSDIIQKHAVDLAARLAPSGWFAFSGCPSHHREPTRAAIEAAGLQIERITQKGRWVTFSGVRSQD